MSSPTPLRKEVFILAVAGVILFITGLYVGVEWMQSFPSLVENLPHTAGYARTVLSGLLVLLMGGNALSGRDRVLLTVAFAFTLVADYFLVLRGSNFLLGLGLFLIVHIVLSIRHAQGFGASLAPEQRGRTLRLLLVTALVAFGATGLLLWQVMGILQRSGQVLVDIVYVLVLTVSLWMAWGTLIRGFYPRLNAWFIAVGMTNFYLCDVSVGLSADLQGTTAGALLNNLIGFFYTPALVLLALSGYRWAGTETRALRLLEPPGAQSR